MSSMDVHEVPQPYAIGDFLQLLKAVLNSDLCSRDQDTIISQFVSRNSREEIPLNKRLDVNLARRGLTSRNSYGLRDPDHEDHPSNTSLGTSLSALDSLEHRYILQFMLSCSAQLEQGQAEISEKVWYAFHGRYTLDRLVYEMNKGTTDWYVFILHHAERLIHSYKPMQDGLCDCPDQNAFDGQDPLTISDEEFVIVLVQTIKKYLAPKLRQIVQGQDFKLQSNAPAPLSLDKRAIIEQTPEREIAFSHKMRVAKHVALNFGLFMRLDSTQSSLQLLREELIASRAH